MDAETETAKKLEEYPNTMQRLRNWYWLQRLSWIALFKDPKVMANSLRSAALEATGANTVSDEDLIRQAYQDKLNGKTNEQSLAMQTLKQRHNL